MYFFFLGEKMGPGENNSFLSFFTKPLNEFFRILPCESPYYAAEGFTNDPISLHKIVANIIIYLSMLSTKILAAKTQIQGCI